MLRAVPAIMLIAASREPALRSGILSSAISLTCALVMVATLSRLGRAEALSMPHAFLMRTGAGGVFRMKVTEGRTDGGTGGGFPCGELQFHDCGDFFSHNTS